eukprot:5751176-Ditylum_brightwellii.AAC.1
MKKFPSGTKRDAIKISDVTGTGFGTKPSTSKTGWQEEKSKPAKSQRANGRGQGQGRGGREKTSGSKQENYKQGRAIAASVFKNIKAISKKKGEVGE